MRALPRLSVDAQLHGEIVRIGNLVGGDDPRAKRAEGVDTLAEAEHAGLHLAALNVAGSDVVEDYIAANAFRSLFRRKMLATFFQNYGEFQFVIQFLREVLGINYGLVVADDGVEVLEEEDPRHHGMGESGLGCFFVVLAEVASGVKELARNDRSLEFDFGRRVKDGLASGPGCAVVLQCMVEGFVGGFEAGVATLE